MNSPAQILFERIDYDLDYYAEEIRDRVFSEYRDMPWTHEHYQVLQPLIHKELESLVYSILKNFDNVGSVLPEGSGVLGYRLKAVPYEETTNGPLPEIITKAEIDIRTGYDDYCEMWWDYLRQKRERTER